MNLSTKVAYNTIIQVVSKIVSTFLGLIAMAVMTRYLGSAGFGEYTTVITFVSLFAIIADLGLTLVTTQMINRPGVDQDKLLSNLFGFRLVSAVFLVGLAPLAIWFFPYGHDIKMGVLITSIAFFFLALNQIFVSLFQKNLRTERIAIAEVSGRVILVAVVIMARVFDQGLNGMLWAIVYCNFLTFILHYILAKRFAKVRLKFNWPIWREIMGRSWPLLLTIAFNLIYLKADIIFLSLMKTKEEVGIYGASYKVVDVLVTVPFLFAGIMLPILVNRWSNNLKQDFFRILQKMFDLTAIMVIPLMFGGYFLAHNIMLLVAGSEFTASGPILQILLLSVGALFFACVFTHTMISLDKQKKLIIYYLITAVTALPLYLVMIKKWSYFGAAWGTVYSEFLILIFAVILVWHYGKFLPNLKVFAKSLLASGIMAIGLFFASAWIQDSGWRLLGILIISVLFYFSLLYWFKGISKQDLLALTNRKR
ncbi:MAG: flippase [bacterium]